MRTAIAQGIIALLLASACEPKRSPAPSAPTSDAKAPPPGSAHASSSAAPPRTSAARAPSSAAPPAASAAPAASGRTNDPADTRWLIDQPVVLGPAAPATATTRGVVMLTKSGRARLAALDTRAPVAADEPAQTPMAPLAPPDALAPFARGPSVAGDFAYFVSRGRLLRARVDAEADPETLAEGARDGVRVAAGGERPVSVAYLAEAEGGTRARLWLEGASPLDISPEGASPTSVALLADGDTRLVFSLEGRTGMSPVHVRRVSFQSGRAKLDEDVVVWVGGPAQSLTEVSAARAGGEVFAFVPLERDATSFGLASLALGAEPRMDAPVTWQTYPNGLDPAPTATGRLCGAAVIAAARPSSAAPHAPVELTLAPVTRNGPGASVVIARAPAIADLSLAELPAGALVAWASSGHVFAARVRCRRGGK